MITLEKIIYFITGIYILVFPIIPGNFNIKGVLLDGNIILNIIAGLFFMKQIIKILIVKFSNTKFIPSKLSQRKLFQHCLFKTHNLSHYPLSLSLIIFSLAVILSITYSSDKTIAFYEAFRLFTIIALYLVLKYSINSKKKLSIYLRFLMMSAFIVFFLGIIEYIIKVFHIYKDIPPVQIRIFSVLEQPNNLGVYAIFFIFPGIMLFIKEKKREYKIFYGLLTLLGIINIFLSGSRNAMQGLIFGLVGLSLIYNFKIIFINIIFPLLFIIPQFRLRFCQIGDMSQNYSRINIWKTVLYMIKDNPIWGIGIGNFSYKYPIYLKLHPQLVNLNEVNSIFHAHNLYLKFYSELGLFGFSGFISFIIFTFSNLKRYISLENNSFLYSFFYGFGVSFLVFLEMSIFDNFFSATKILSLFFILIGIMEGNYRINKEANQKNKEIEVNKSKIA